MVIDSPPIRLNPTVTAKVFQHRRSAFSLIEIIIVIGLIALVGSLIVVNVDGLLRGLGDRPIDETFRFAVREARYQASARKDPTFIRFNEETRAFEVMSDTGELIEEFKLSGYDEDALIEVFFFQILPAEGLNTVSSREITDIPRISFRPDRSSTPFEVEFQIESATWRQTYDPFSDIIVTDSRPKP